MPAISGLRSPYDKTAGGLHHLGRMFDKIRLMSAGTLPEDLHRNYGLSIGLDGMMCGFLGVSFPDVEARVRAGGSDEELTEWVFARGLRPNRTQTLIWNEFTRKAGWNDRLTPYLRKQIAEAGLPPTSAETSLDLIEITEGRPPLGNRT
ncbi:MAG: DUF5069 domain-containing protein [Verrucomicrobia bacterium]|nr:DUF5069 domain-containing protein [Verrucomicrobiota bacterium]